MTPKPEQFCYRIEIDHEGILAGRPHFFYVIALTMDEACKYAKDKKDVFDEIISCKLMGDAP